jgi:hypothetical protein
MRNDRMRLATPAVACVLFAAALAVDQIIE